MRRKLLLVAVLATGFLAFRIAEEPGQVDAPANEADFRRAAQLRGLAQADMEDGNYGRAIESLQALAALLPENILAPVNLAICHFRLNQADQALSQVRKAQALAPDNPQMLYALARILQDQVSSREEWEEVLDHFAETHPRDPRPHFLRADQAAREQDWAEALQEFRQASRHDPENLTLLTEQLVAAAEVQDLEATSDSLDAIEDRLNGFEGSLVEYSDRLRDLIDEGDAQALRPPALVLRNLLRPTDLYQLGLIPLIGGLQTGGPMFPQLDFDPPLPKSIQGGQDIVVEFVDASRDWSVDFNTDARLTLLAPGSETVDLLQLGERSWHRLSLATSPPTGTTQAIDSHGVDTALYRDIDQDSVSDLVGIDILGRIWFFQGAAEGGFAPGSPIFKGEACQGLHDLHPLDIDHDGDLDLFASCSSGDDVYLQNNGDRSWTNLTEELGLDTGHKGSTGLVTADFDDDGDLDLLTTHSDAQPRLFINRRAGPLVESSATWGLDRAAVSTTGASAADFNNDGLFDLLLWGDSGGEIYLNRGDGFDSAPLPQGLARRWQTAIIGDFDNDGDQDAVVALGDPDHLVFLRNRRTSFEVEEIPHGLKDRVVGFLAADFDNDGDLDIAARQAGQPEALVLLRNDGGNRNQWLGLHLQGRHDNNSKNNTQGLFTRLEVRIGDAYQALIGNGGINHLGLGAARQADVIRVVWTNGVAQTWLRVAANRTLVEEQILKGSCPFLYTWNGAEFEFVTDLMWRSPLGMIFPDGSPAPHQSARDYVLIRQEQLAPSGNEIWIQITEELWEAVYTDDMELMAVDHPREVELVVDEAFRPPPHPRLPPVHWIDRRLPPAAAYDQSGRDVLSLIATRDDRYVDELPLSRYQGLTQGHHLEMTFHQVPDQQPLRLLLWGWIFPTDTSINFALHQDSLRQSRPPSLEIQDTTGAWRTFLPFLGFPNGKRKAVVVDLGQGQFSGTVRLRIPTNMQIYWDAAVLAIGDPEPSSHWTHLKPQAADLHYRGYSQMYRESSTGPHLFDYSQVDTGPRFRDLVGQYTRFGAVADLLTEADDRYVVMNAGDEMTVHFDAGSLPTLPPGWRRDWILYTDGWVKDGDIHTAASQTVEPLPYHGMSSYPDSPTHTYPDSDLHRNYLKQFQTRSVSDKPFRGEIKSPGSTLDGTDPNG